MNKETDSASKSSKRDEMVKYAYDLFYKNGFHATGVDTVIEGTGISKRTLYKHFASKEGLIIATIDYYHQTMYKAISDYLEKDISKSPVDKALRIFDFLAELVDAGKLYGCFAMNAKTEYASKAKEIEAAYDAYVAAIQQLIEFYLENGNTANSKSLAMQIIILFEGAIIRSKGIGNSQPVKLAKKAAEIICNQ
ncbi:TetR/AcrR family transcriptional regulator [Pedobacter hiemivivus]|uniref:TetR/AcrR family transcriptional regulator n=1 Tax=Pedobacter hiemivivus TaxID=2530454 RepID=A0A4U1GBK4_9SPHI|nr:TetR/AcrR family transcriptional regulator [Pedobacter hiemivivus]TKC58512.1 TetR/AcrR family transcriptional regulator [Pedobacter hiemivivus]